MAVLLLRKSSRAPAHQGRSDRQGLVGRRVCFRHAKRLRLGGCAGVPALPETPRSPIIRIHPSEA